MDTVQISYFSVFVRWLINAATFCNGAPGLKLCLHESDFGFALVTPALFATIGEITSITGTNRAVLGHLTLLV